MASLPPRSRLRGHQPSLAHTYSCDCDTAYPSLGPEIVQTTLVLPIVTRLLPSVEGWVDMLADSLRSSFHRRPSVRRCVVLYVESVSRGILTIGRE